MQAKHWAWVNGFFLIANVVGGSTMGGSPALPVASGGVTELVVLAIAAALAVIAVGASGYLLSGRGKGWKKPSVRRCPINFGDPMQTIYIGVLAIIAQAIGLALVASVRAEQAMLMLSLGIGALAGSLAVSTAIFGRVMPGRFNDDQ
ncbi:hypothetical protein [Stenotrophomonas sp.]|uniref:hypothetical protein n=1 Tax=Stenotrophomonas sp. TaxID=69392 RepID=UPI00289F8761|nr:hypothetical protein [Stenotrophomonas sp.]